jgi:hypothetical protein
VSSPEVEVVGVRPPQGREAVGEGEGEGGESEWEEEEERRDREKRAKAIIDKCAGVRGENIWTTVATIIRRHDH